MCFNYRQCVICKYFGTGTHHGIWTCDACAKFFARVKSQNLNYQCKRKKDCNTFDVNGRRICKNCRFKDCVQNGMK